MKTMKKLVSILLCAVLLLSVMPVVSFSAFSYYALELDEINVVSYNMNDGWAYYSFTPDASAYYSFYSFGSEDSYVYCYDQYGNELGFDDDSGKGLNFSYNAYLEKNTPYYFITSGELEQESSFVVGIRCLSERKTPDMKVGETRYSETHELNTSNYYKFTPQVSDYYVFYSEGEYDTYAFVYDEEWNLMVEDDDSGVGDNFALNTYLEEGKTYYFEYTSYSKWIYTYSKISIEPTEVVTDIEITKYPKELTYYEDFVYGYVDYSGLELKLTYTDGTVVDWAFDDEEEIVGTTVYLDCYEDDNGDYYVYVSTGFADNYYYLEVVPNPVESISVVSGSEIECFVGGLGYYDNEMGQYIYMYSIPNDFMINVKYTDGTSETVNYYDGINGKAFFCYDGQYYGDVWGVGNNTAYIEYYGVYDTVDVVLKDSPVESLTLITAPERVYVMGDENYGYSYDGVYYLLPYDIKGLSFEAKFKDGTTKVYTNEDYDFDEWTIDGYDFGMNPIEVKKPGYYQNTINFLGAELNYDVTVIANVGLIGDVDGDGEVTIIDATEIQRYVASLTDFDARQKIRADVDGDGEISIIDATQVQLIVARIL